MGQSPSEPNLRNHFEFFPTRKKKKKRHLILQKIMQASQRRSWVAGFVFLQSHIMFEERDAGSVE